MVFVEFSPCYFYGGGFLSLQFESFAFNLHSCYILSNVPRETLKNYEI